MIFERTLRITIKVLVPNQMHLDQKRGAKDPERSI